MRLIRSMVSMVRKDLSTFILGKILADMDQNLERTDWKGDDKEDGTGDEGIDQILPTGKATQTE